MCVCGDSVAETATRLAWLALGERATALKSNFNFATPQRQREGESHRLFGRLIESRAIYRWIEK